MIREKATELVGNLRIVGADQGKIKTELAEKVLSMPLFRNVAKKRKVTVDFAQNLKYKCQRRTSPQELFLDACIEHYGKEVEDLEVNLAQVHA